MRISGHFMRIKHGVMTARHGDTTARHGDNSARHGVMKISRHFMEKKCRFFGAMLFLTRARAHALVLIQKIVALLAPRLIISLLRGIFFGSGASSATCFSASSASSATSFGASSASSATYFRVTHLLCLQFEDAAGVVLPEGHLQTYVHEEASSELFAIEGAGFLANPDVTLGQRVGLVGIEAG